MFCDGFKFNLVRFNDYKKLMHDLCVTGQIRKAFFHLVLHPVLHLTLRPTLKTWASWWLLYQRPMLGESMTWVLFTLMASSY
jgi:hypothetical protein